MKIAFIINSLKSRNGASIFLKNLVVAFNQKYTTDQIILISLFDNIDPSIYKSLQSEKIDIYFCHKKRKNPFSGSKELKQILKNFNPDVVNLHLSILPTYFFAFGFKKKKWKIVKTYHSIPGKDLSKLSLKIEKAYSRRNLISFIGISETISQISKSIYPSNKTETIFNGIPLREIGFSDSKIYDYIIVASLEPVKNHMFLLELFAENKEYFYNKKLLVVGDGSLSEQYKKYCCDKNLSNIIFAGNCDDVYEKLSQSKIFLLTSIREGNPISLLEAINAGLPVLVPNIGGIPDVVINSNIGYLFEVNNKNDFFEKLKILDKDPSCFYQYNTNYSKTFSILNTAEEYRNFFLSLIG